MASSLVDFASNSWHAGRTFCLRHCWSILSLKKLELYAFLEKPQSHEWCQKHLPKFPSREPPPEVAATNLKSWFFSMSSQNVGFSSTLTHRGVIVWRSSDLGSNFFRCWPLDVRQHAIELKIFVLPFFVFIILTWRGNLQDFFFMFAAKKFYHFLPIFFYQFLHYWRSSNKTLRNCDHFVPSSLCDRVYLLQKIISCLYSQRILHVQVLGVIFCRHTLYMI